jgi:secernin
VAPGYVDRVCDLLVALGPATDSGRTLFAKNSDRPPAEAQELEWLAPRRDDGRVATTYAAVDAAPGWTVAVLGSRPAWMWGLEHGVNEAGVAVGNAAIFTTLDPHDAAPALTGMDLVRLALERATTAPAAVEVILTLLDRYGQGGSGHDGVDDPYWSSFLAADADEAWVVETSGRKAATERVALSRAISNRTSIPAFDAEHRDPTMDTSLVVDPRWHASQACLGREPVSVPSLERHLRDHRGEAGWSICMHVADFSVTTAGIVAELPGPFVSGRPLAHVCLGAPCTSIFVPVAVGRPLGDPPPWARFQHMTPDHAAQLCALEAELAAAAPAQADDDAWAGEAWRRVEGCLR